MAIGIFVKLVFILTITAFLLTRKENYQAEYFSHQAWTTRDVLPVYWVFIVILLSLIVLFNFNSNRRLYIIISSILTLLAGSILFCAIKILFRKRKITSIEVVGAKSSDLYWLLILIVIQYSILLVFLYSKNSVVDHRRIFWVLGYYAITLVLWPVIESVFYLGMMFIPTSRIVGVIKSAVLISILQSLSHFNYDFPELIKNFAIFGLLGCYLYIKSGRIIVPLLVHSSVNFLALTRDIRSLMP